MAITNNPLDKGKKIITNLEYMKLIPYEGENEDELSKTKSYTFDTLLEDSVSVQNDENTTNQRGSETKDEPAIQNTILGSFQVAATSLDVQQSILVELLGWIQGGGSDTDVTYAPVSYKPMYVMIVLGFKSMTDCLVLPRVRLNSKLMIASLKTSSGQVDIAGTAYAGKITVNSAEVSTPAAFVPAEKLGTVVPALSPGV